jgi:hypothetical protein
MQSPWEAFYGNESEKHTTVAGGSALPGRLRNCVVYRAGQKRLARGYLDLARSAVMEELTRMQGLLHED